MAYGKKSFRENRVDGYKCSDSEWGRLFPKPDLSDAQAFEKRLREESAEMARLSGGVVGVDVGKDGDVVTTIIPLNASAKAAVKKFHEDKIMDGPPAPIKTLTHAAVHDDQSCETARSWGEPTSMTLSKAMEHQKKQRGRDV